MLAFDLCRTGARFGLAGEQLRLAAEHAYNAGDGGLRSRALGWYVLALIRGAADAAEIRGELDAIEREELSPYLAAWIAVGRAELARLAGSFADARRSAEQAIELFQAMGIKVLAAACNQLLTETELSAGEPERALSGLLEADASLVEMGERGIRSTIQALLAQVYERMGDRESARAAIEVAEELGGEEDEINFVITHAVRARLVLADEDGEAAVGWALSAAEHASRTEEPLARADAEVELARVLSAIGRSQQAISHARTALELADAKGDRPRAAQAQALLDKLDARA
jgi:tetratricopeptide (TPR) repeat protein